MIDKINIKLKNIFVICIIFILAVPIINCEKGNFKERSAYYLFSKFEKIKVNFPEKNASGTLPARFVQNDEKIIIASTGLNGNIILYDLHTQRIERKIEFIAFKRNIYNLFCLIPNSAHSGLSIPKNGFSLSNDENILATAACNENELIIGIFTVDSFLQTSAISIEKGKLLFGGDIFFSRDNKYISLIIKNLELNNKNAALINPREIKDRFNIIIWDRNDFSKKVDKNLIMSSEYGLFINAIEFIDFNKILIKKATTIDFFNVSNNSVIDQFNNHDSILDYLYNDKYVFFTSSISKNAEENVNDNQDICLKIYDLAQNKFIYISPSSWNYHIVGLVNSKILIFNEQKAIEIKDIDAKGQKYKYIKIDQNMIHYFNLKNHKYIFSIRLFPQCNIISIARNGKIMLIVCKNKQGDQNYYFSYLNKEESELIDQID